jgi:hypothetical protein
MLFSRFILASIAAFFLPLVSARPVVPIEQSLQPVASIPRTCEIRQEAWCIYQDGSEITDLQKIDNKNSNEHIWSMRDINHPYSVIIIFEPDGCRNGFSDKISALGFDENVKWRGRIWDQMRVRLRADGSCDLRLLVPLYNKDPLEWAFSVGRTLIAACADKMCKSIVPTLADVTDKYQKQFKREKEKSN